MNAHRLGYILNIHKAAVTIFALSVTMLSGCAAAEDLALKYSGIFPEEDVRTYTELRDAGRLDEEGFYQYDGAGEDKENENQEGDAHPEGIHVTFGDNPYLEISYYLDEERTKPADLQDCYLHPGDCLYASEPVCLHPAGELYCFARFHIYAWEDGKAAPEEHFWENGEDSLVVRIPEGYAGRELSVMPMGQFKKRTLSLTAFYKDTTGRKQDAAGKWKINEQEVTGKTIQVSPARSLEVDYLYDWEKYSFVSSVPESFYSENGLVRFKASQADSSIQEYSVELRPVRDEFLFDPSQYEAEHGKVTFEYNGRALTEKLYLSDGSIIHYTAEPEPGYHHAKGSGDIEIQRADSSGTAEKFQEAILFYPDEEVEVYLPQPQKGGTIEYSTEGRVLTGESCRVPAGAVITMKFRGWTGWVSQVLDGAEYTVKEGQGVRQTVSIEGADIYEIFREVDQYKPTLKVVLNETVQGALLGISARGVENENLTYGEKGRGTWISDWRNQNNRTVFDQVLGGTDQDITITISNDAILNGYALKMEIVRIDSEGGRKEQIRYIKKLPAQEKIQIYDREEAEANLAACKEITVTFSKVEVRAYTQKTIDHAKLQVAFDDSQEGAVPRDGDILEPDRKVAVTLMPDQGYYVEGSKEEDGSYTDTMTFSKWEKNGEKILDRHPVKKFWHVTLDGSDDYGVCVYKLDGQEVSGTIRLRQDQKLTLRYTLNDPSHYRIVRKTGIIGRIEEFLRESQEEITIPVSQETDGSTIKRGDYITVEPKEGKR